MIRKLTVVLLTGVICLLGVTSAWAVKYNEAPMLQVKVAAGELPSVEERLPEEPKVIEPIEEIGQYGGVMQLVTGVRYVCYTMFEGINQKIAGFTLDGKEIEPCVAKGWDLSDDYKTLTLYLRKGMKWSDGEPFTADDILFWYQDIILNDELTPVKPKQWMPGGEPMKVKKIDNYTIQLEFSVPHLTVIEVMSGYVLCAYPKHYVKKYHIKYNAKADEIAREEGYDHWWQAFQWHSADPTLGEDGEDLNRPTVKPWVLKKVDAAQNRYYERNPYYWKVDTAGNQLPYIDEVTLLSVATSEIVALKAMSVRFIVL